MSATALSPDLILTNANVLTADAANSRAEAVAVWRGRIGAVGAARDIDALADARTRVIYLKGRTVLPEHRLLLPRPTYRERMAMARRGWGAMDPASRRAVDTLAG